MIDKLVEFGKTLRDENSHDAIREEPIHIEIIIDEQGNFHNFIDCPENIKTMSEAILAKKGKARLLVDKLEETLNFDEKKHKLYIEKLESYNNIDKLKPVLLFYRDNKSGGLEKARGEYEKKYSEAHQKVKGTMHYCFRLLADSRRINEYSEVLDEIKKRYDEKQSESKSEKICSICGTSEYPITNSPHGAIKSVPNGQSSGCALVSYNERAFESYYLDGNLNSNICERCAKNYTSGFNELLSNHQVMSNEKGKPYRVYKYRKNLGGDSAILFWLRGGGNINAILDLEDTTEFTEIIQENEDDFFRDLDDRVVIETRVDAFNIILDAVCRKDGEDIYQNVDEQKFYSMIVSGEAARIAVRSWAETTASDVKQNIAHWFDDIRINAYGKNNTFFSIPQLVRAITLEWHTSTPIKKGMEKNIYRSLWFAALFNKAIPCSLLKEVISSVFSSRHKDKNNSENKKVGVLPEQVALLKIILKRGEFYMDSNKKDEMEIAYTFGKLFALYELIQKVALGQDINSGIAERYFTSACTTPSRALGKIGDLGKKHISKISKEKKVLSRYYEKELAKMMPNIKDLPTFFSLEARAKFIIGYYSQCQERAPKKEELDETTEY